MNATRVRLLSDLAKNDTVRTPSGRMALMAGFDEGAVVVRFVVDGEEATILPHLLTLIGKAPPHVFPAHFFQGGIKKAMAQ